MQPRFLVPTASGAGHRLGLPADEARHAARVLRLRPGDAATVFDGRGHEWRAVVLTVDRHRVEVEVGDAIEPALEPRVAVTLAQAVLKADHMDAAVRDATMMGVVAMQPLLTAFTAAHAAAAAGTKVVQRWERIAVASAKQCRRAVVPRIDRARPLAETLAALEEQPREARIVLAEPAAGRAVLTPSELGPVPLHAWLAVGPEGGWAAEELDLLVASGFQPLTLGSRTIRADAAAVVAISMLRVSWKDL